MEYREKQVRMFIDSLKLDYQYMKHIVYKMLISDDSRIDYIKSMRIISRQLEAIESSIQNAGIENVNKFLKMKKLDKYTEKRDRNGKR